MKKFLIVLLLLNLFWVVELSPVYAESIHTDFTLQEIPEDEQAKIFQNIAFRRTEEEYNTGSKIVSFSYSNLKKVAIGLEDKHINVYDSKGRFEYSYAFSCNGAFRFSFDSKDGNLLLYLIRGDLVIKISPEGDLIEAAKVLPIDENAKHFRSNWNSKTVIDTDNVRYQLKKSYPWLMFSGYHKAVISENGVERIFFDGTQLYTEKLIFILLLIGVFIIIVMAKLIGYLRSQNKKRRKVYGVI